MVKWVGSTKWRKVLKFIKKECPQWGGCKIAYYDGVIVNKNIF